MFCFKKKKDGRSSAPGTEGSADPLPSLPSGSAFHSPEALAPWLPSLQEQPRGQGSRTKSLLLDPKRCPWLSSPTAYPMLSEGSITKAPNFFSSFTIPSLQSQSIYVHRSFDFCELYFCFILLCSREMYFTCRTKQQVIYLTSRRLLSS